MNNKKMDELTFIILAGGKGTRMKSALPKVLHPVAGRPMIERVIRCIQQAGANHIRVVIGHGAQLVRSIVEPLGAQCFIQEQQLGTADAVRSAQVENLEGDVVIVNGDHPLISAEDFKAFLTEYRENKLDLALVTVELENPGDFGRIVRHRGDMRAIVEAKDASAETLKINEVNAGIYLVKAKVLADLLPKISNKNAKQEFYLTELVSLSVENGYKINAIKGSSRVAVGVNSQVELARATRFIYRRNVLALMENGVVVMDPRTVYVEDGVKVGSGSVIYPNVFLRGSTTIGSFCVVESNSFISDSTIGDSVQIKAGSYIERTQIYAKASVGPYARLRPETVIGEEAHVGNFVEMKKVQFGKGSKAGHLTYLGDAEIGENVNIGCGTITCNYAVDRKKYKTVIGDRVFVGSDSQFVAPVHVGSDAVIGSGTTVTKDVPANALAVGRAKQIIRENYVGEKLKKDETKIEGQ